MNHDSPAGRCPPGWSGSRVHAIAVPPSARALSTLRRIGHADAFLVGIRPAQRRTAQEWARAVLLDAPLAVRSKLLPGWSAIGLKVGNSGRGDSLLGWQVRRDSPDFVVSITYGASGRRDDELRITHSTAQCDGISRHRDRGVTDVANVWQQERRATILAFRRAVEAHEFDSIGELFVEDIVLFSPIAFQPYHGREVVAKIISILPAILDDFAFQREIEAKKGEDHALVFGARIGELSIQGCDLLHVNSDGLIDELTVMLRPLRAVLAFEQEMRAKFTATRVEPR